MTLDWIDQICEALKEVIYTFKNMETIGNNYCDCGTSREVNIINGKYICTICNKSLMNLTIDQLYSKDTLFGEPIYEEAGKFPKFIIGVDPYNSTDSSKIITANLVNDEYVYGVSK